MKEPCRIRLDRIVFPARAEKNLLAVNADIFISTSWSIIRRINSAGEHVGVTIACLKFILVICPMPELHSEVLISLGTTMERGAYVTDDLPISMLSDYLPGTDRRVRVR